MNTKQKILSTINMLVILVVPIYYAMVWETISIAAVAGEYTITKQLTTDFVKNLNHTYNLAIFVDMGIYALFQLFAYLAYIFKCKKLQIIILITNICLAIISIVVLMTNQNANFGLTWVIPVINSALYICINKADKKIEN